MDHKVQAYFPPADYPFSDILSETSDHGEWLEAQNHAMIQRLEAYNQSFVLSESSLGSLGEQADHTDKSTCAIFHSESLYSDDASKTNSVYDRSDSDSDNWVDQEFDEKEEEIALGNYFRRRSIRGWSIVP